MPRSIRTVSAGTGTRNGKRAMADLIFLVNNSGSMGEEAEQLATEINEWSAKLSRVLDLQLGCVGYDGDITGALDLGAQEALAAYLNREDVWGTWRTVGFEGARAEALRTAADNYDTGWGECGATALHFADEHFSFRGGANRIYVNFTDEPNQPDNKPKLSVDSVRSQQDWKVWQGIIHTVFGGSEDYNPETYEWTDMYEEKPWLMSEYTGGTSIKDAPSSFEGVTLEDLPITGG